jgi:hypothetical protein
MADVTKIPGPVPNEPNRESRQIKPGTDKFKDMMKIDKSGEREKKKKKRQEESEEDTKAELRTGVSTPDKVAEAKKAAEFKKIQAVGESEKRQSMAQKRAEESAAAEEAAAAQVNQKKIESLNLEKVEPAAVEKKRSSYQGQIEQQKVVEEEIKAVEEKKELEATTLQREVKKETTTPSSQVVVPAATTLGPLFIAPAPEVAPAYTHLSGEMLALFEKMISQIFIMQAGGINETTIHLNTPEFASSMFAGAQIVIKEFSTAPLSFNIEFLGSPQNSLYFEQNIASLRAAFASEDRKYSVNRIESRLLSKQEKPLFHRKEKTSDKGKEDTF